MNARPNFAEANAMASPWRRRRTCVLVVNGPVPATLREVSGTGAFLETGARPELGTRVELRHPEAGVIGGVITALGRDGIAMSFECSERSVAFALAAITADMSNPG